jgi:hypothetical protein
MGFKAKERLVTSVAASALLCKELVDEVAENPEGRGGQVEPVWPAAGTSRADEPFPKVALFKPMTKVF